MRIEIGENLSVALNGLMANKVRSGLTMLGVLIGVATVIALLSIGEGASASITDQISGAGSNLLIVRSGGGNGRQSGLQSGAATLTLDDAEAIGRKDAVPDAVTVAPQFGQSAQLTFGDVNLTVQVTGVTPAYAQAFSLKTKTGSFLANKDVTGRGNVIVLGSQTAEDLFGGFDPAGRKVKLNPTGKAGGAVPMTVIGVLEEQGQSALMGNPDNGAFVPISTAQVRLFAGRDALGQLMVSTVTVVAGEGQSSAVMGQIQQLLRRRHDIEAGEDDDFNVVSQDDLLSLVGNVTGLFTAFLGVIAVISLVVGGIGIMNIMLVSVTERTREIGIRKAVGARTSDILLQFLFEAIVLSVIGGLMGMGTGIGVSWLITKSGFVTAKVTPFAIVLALTSALTVGVISGVYPARRAAALKPIDALRYE